MSMTYRHLAAAAVIVAGAALAASASATTLPSLNLITLYADNGSPNESIGAKVGFNPQPDPPGKPATMLDLADPFRPAFINGSTGDDFSLVFALEGLGTSVIPLPDAPNADGRTSFEQTIGDHTLDVTLGFLGDGPVIPGTWESFNPQPDPPGDVLGLQFQFEGQADPEFFFTASLDGTPLSFAAAPEPAAWALMIIGVGGVGAMLRRRAVRPALL